LLLIEKPGRRGISSARQQSGQCLLAALRRPAKLAFDEQLLHQIPEDSEPNRVLDQVADHGSLDTITIHSAKIVAVMPTVERSFDLNTFEVMIPFNSVMRAIHRARKGSPGLTRNDVSSSEPTPAIVPEFGTPSLSGGGTSRRASMRVAVSGGMIRGRLLGSAKNRKTRLTGKGTQSSNWTWCNMKATNFSAV